MLFVRVFLSDSQVSCWMLFATLLSFTGLGIIHLCFLWARVLAHMRPCSVRDCRGSVRGAAGCTGSTLDEGVQPYQQDPVGGGDVSCNTWLVSHPETN